MTDRMTAFGAAAAAVFAPIRSTARFLVLAITLFGVFAVAGHSSARAAEDAPAAGLADLPGLPPAKGPIEPRVMPKKGEDALYHQKWFVDSFMDLREDFEAAKAQGKRFVIMIEQRGCIYCVKMQKETLSRKYINDYVRKNFAVLQLNMWGDREVIDFDGTKTTEKKLAARWGAIFTPTIIFFKDDLTGLDGKFGRPLEVARLNQVGPGTFYDMFVWVKHKIYQKEPNFQRFHIARINQRLFMDGKKVGTDGRELKPPKNGRPG